MHEANYVAKYAATVSEISAELDAVSSPHRVLRGAPSQLQDPAGPERSRSGRLSSAVMTDWPMLTSGYC